MLNKLAIYIASHHRHRDDGAYGDLKRVHRNAHHHHNNKAAIQQRAVHNMSHVVALDGLDVPHSRLRI